MIYSQYITKKRSKFKAICGDVNFPAKTVLPATGNTIYTELGDSVCYITSKNAKDYFYGYDPENPEREIQRQKIAEKLMDTCPKDDGDALAEPDNPWRKYGHLESYLFGGFLWVWDDFVSGLPQFELEHLLNCVKTGSAPKAAFLDATEVRE